MIGKILAELAKEGSKEVIKKVPQSLEEKIPTFEDKPLTFEVSDKFPTFEDKNLDIDLSIDDSSYIEDSKNEELDSSNDVNDEKEVVEELHNDYMEDIKNNSDYPETIEDQGSDYEKISPEENAEKRAEFNANKEKLIKEWEEKNGQEWPRYEEDVVMNGKVIRRAGDKYDAHHIKPLGLGGKNEAGNLTPISAEKHFDKKGVHAPDSPYAKLDNHYKEKEK